jgi:hypothetical protein
MSDASMKVAGNVPRLIVRDAGPGFLYPVLFKLLG